MIQTDMGPIADIDASKRVNRRPSQQSISLSERRHQPTVGENRMNELNVLALHNMNLTFETWAFINALLLCVIIFCGERGIRKLVNGQRGRAETVGSVEDDASANK